MNVKEQIRQHYRTFRKSGCTAREALDAARFYVLFVLVPIAREKDRNV